MLATRLETFLIRSSAVREPNFLPSTRQRKLMMFGSRQAIVSKLCTATDAVSIVSALTINGGSASGGATALHGKLKSWTTTKGDTMSIKREDLDAGRVSFADVTSGRRLAPVHPGEILRDDFLEPMKVTVYALAQVIKVPRSRVNDIVLGRRGITTDTHSGSPAILVLRQSFGSICRRITI